MCFTADRRCRMGNVSRCAGPLVVSAFFCAVGSFTLSATRSPAVVHVAVPFCSLVTSTSGQEQYQAYCAGCHGQSGRGDGRSSHYCSVPPTNLTRLAEKNQGIYPEDHVCDVLRHGTGRVAKGHGYMPVWEPLLKSMNKDASGATEQRIKNLAAYIKTLQA